MTSVTDIVIEMADLQDVLVSKLGQTAKDNCVTTLIAKIESLSTCDSKGALKLTSALEASSIHEKIKGQIQGAIDARYSAGFAPLEAVAKSKAAQQQLTNTLNFLTQGDWHKILAPKATPHQIMNIITTRLALLGIRHLHEQTVKWPIAIVLFTIQRNTGLFPKYQVLKDYVEDFKKHFDAFKTPYPHKMLVTFPADPSSLPKDIFNTAYPDEADPPVQQSLPGFSALGQHIPLRNNSALLVKERAQEQAARQHMVGWSAAPGYNMPGSSATPDYSRRSLQPFQDPNLESPRASPIPGFAGAGRTGPQGSPTQEHGAATVPLQDSPAAQGSAGAAQEQPEVVGASAVPGALVRFAPGNLRSGILKGTSLFPGGKVGDEPTMQELEDKTFAALKTRPQKKRPAAATSKKSKKGQKGDDDDDHEPEDDEEDEDAEGSESGEEGDEADEETKPMKAMKRPALQCKPAAFDVSEIPQAKPGRKPVFNLKLDKSLAKTTVKKNYASSWYCRVRRSMKQAGFDDEAARAEARIYHGMVITKWDKMFGKGALPAMKALPTKKALPAMKAMKAMKAKAK